MKTPRGRSREVQLVDVYRRGLRFRSRPKTSSGGLTRSLVAANVLVADAKVDRDMGIHFEPLVHRRIIGY